MTEYCPSCWIEVGQTPVCPACGANLESLSRESYEEKLIRALRHREPTVPIRAAAILGELGATAAVVPLMELAASDSDSYIQEAAVVALERIGDSRAAPLLIRLEQDGSLRVRIAAGRAIKTLEGLRDAS